MPKEELRSKMVHMREQRPSTAPRFCKDSSTLNRKIDSEKVKTKMSIEDKRIILAKFFIMPKAKQGKCI